MEQHGTSQPAGEQPAKTSVLVVDDDPESRLLVETYLRCQGFDVHSAPDVAGAREILAHVVPGLMLLDVSMPGISGIDFLPEIRSAPATRDMPVIIISGFSDSETMVRGLSGGATDYVTKPVDLPVLLARIKAHVELARRVTSLEIESQKLSAIAHIDELTGAANRRSLYSVLDKEIDRSRRYDHEVSVLMLDLDSLKDVNDRFGHDVGDDILREVCQRMASVLRTSDTLCRYGGDEFAVVLPHAEHASAMQAAEHILYALRRQPFHTRGNEVMITASIGVATAKSHDKCEAAELLRRADQAMYEAKRHGKNQACCYGESRLYPQP